VAAVVARKAHDGAEACGDVLVVARELPGYALDNFS
jgi:hypothetical protein